jgi:hypothetical protein
MLPEKGLAVTHLRHGRDSRSVHHQDQVLVEGTSEEEISVTIDVKAPSKISSNAINITRYGNELIIDV